MLYFPFGLSEAGFPRCPTETYHFFFCFFKAFYIPAHTAINGRTIDNVVQTARATLFIKRDKLGLSGR